MQENKINYRINIIKYSCIIIIIILVKFISRKIIDVLFSKGLTFAFTETSKKYIMLEV